jgi:hypothetical protein
MNVITDALRFLVQRKLWPVALLLLAVAVAVPLLLSEDPAPGPAIAAVKADESTLATDPIVAPAGDGDRAGRRHVLGSRKDPFKPNATPTPTPTATPTPAASTAPATSPPGATVGAPGGGGGVGTAPAPDFTSPVTPVTPAKSYEDYELAVRFGSSEEHPLPRKSVKLREALPSSDDPVLIYLGVLKNTRTAVFMVDSGVVSQGDGECTPSSATCVTIHLREGETEFFDVPADAAGGSEPAASADGTAAPASTQYQLDLIKIRKP